MATFVGVDIGGSGNTFVAHLDSSQTVNCTKSTSDTVTIAGDLWGISTANGRPSPQFVVIDGPLSHDHAQAKGWRPCDSAMRDRLKSAGLSNRVVSPSSFKGHRHLELSNVFGAYWITAETHPTVALVDMGADINHIKAYKLKPKRNANADERKELLRKKRSALSALTAWLTKTYGVKWSTAPTSDGELDATICAMVAAAIGGYQWPTLELYSPILPVGQQPRSSLAGSAPLYLLRKLDTGASTKVSKVSETRGQDYWIG